MRSRTAGGMPRSMSATQAGKTSDAATPHLTPPPARRRAVSTGSRGDAGVTPGVCHARAGTDPRHPRREVDVPTLASAESHHSSFSGSGTGTHLVAARLSLIHISEPTRLG